MPAQLLRVKDGPDIVQLEIYTTGPQWQRRVRILVGQPGQMVNHGNMFCSEAFVAILFALMGNADHPLRIIDRTGPEPIFYRTEIA